MDFFVFWALALARLFFVLGFTYWRTAVGVGTWLFVFSVLDLRTGVQRFIFHEDHRGGALCGQHSEDRGGGRSVLKRRSVPPPLPSETSHPSSLIQAVMRLRRVVGSEC